MSASWVIKNNRFYTVRQEGKGPWYWVSLGREPVAWYAQGYWDSARPGREYFVVSCKYKHLVLLDKEAAVYGTKTKIRCALNTCGIRNNALILPLDDVAEAVLKLGGLEALASLFSAENRPYLPYRT